MLSSLPGRALTRREVRSLEGSDRIELARAILGLDPTPTEDIVAIYVGQADSASVLTYEPDERGWTVTNTLSVTDPIDRFDAVTDEVLEWGQATYGDRIVVVSDDQKAPTIDHMLPRRPVSKGEVMQLESLPGIEYVHPLFCFEDTHEIVAILFTTRDDPTAADATIGNMAFDPETESWEMIETVAFDVDRDVTGSPEVGQETIHEWLEDHYDTSELLAISPDPV